MRIRIGVAAADMGQRRRDLPSWRGGGIGGMIRATSHRLAVVVIRTGRETIFLSPARITSASSFVGTVHTNWITVPAGQDQVFSDLRGKSVRVSISGTCSSSGARSPVNVQLQVAGPSGGTVAQRVLAQGDLQGTVEARASLFVRTDPIGSSTTLPGPISAMVRSISWVSSQF